MPILGIPTEARDKAIELARKAEAPDASTWDVAFRHGFMEGLRSVLPSEVVGLIVMDCDCAMEGEPLATEQLPRLAWTAKP